MAVPSTAAGLRALREALAGEVAASVCLGAPVSEAATARLREVTATLTAATEAERLRVAEGEAAHRAALAALADAGHKMSAFPPPPAASLTAGAAGELARAKASAVVESRGAEAALSKGPLHTTAADEREMLTKAKKTALR
jgi:hypothetical protein